VLLFDEPTAALDPRTQHWLLDLVVELHQAGKTIVCATHDLASLNRVADRCVVLSEDHEVVATAPPAEILADDALLEATNLVHTHAHRHRDPTHTHRHEVGHHRPAEQGRPE
jgi:cobalt/nickel transport system ATP-binding protein